LKKNSDSDYEIMNLVEKNVDTPAILGRALVTLTLPNNIVILPKSQFHLYLEVLTV
jgi:hypothetical protein